MRLTMLLLTALVLIASPAACKKSGGGKKSQPAPTATPKPSAKPKTPDSTPQGGQATITNWTEFTGKAIAFQQAISPDASRLRVTGRETYFQNGQSNPDAKQIPADASGTVCFLRFATVDKNKTALEASSRFLVSQAQAPEQKTSYYPSSWQTEYFEATLDGELQGSANDSLSKIICRKHVDAGAITANDLQTAFNGYIQIQTQ